MNCLARMSPIVAGIYQFALAKYGRSGLVLFHLPDFGYTLPNSPEDFWTDGTPTYGLSHFTPSVKALD